MIEDRPRDRRGILALSAIGSFQLSGQYLFMLTFLFIVGSANIISHLLLIKLASRPVSTRVFRLDGC